MSRVGYSHAARHKIFSELVAAVLESHYVPAAILPRKTYSRLADAMADDAALHPDLAVSGLWVEVTSTPSMARIGEYIDAGQRDAQIAGSADPVAVVSYRRGRSGADGIASMSLDDLAELLARMSASESPVGQ
ncbi:hypothetical protein GCM10022240_13240 [Microbacterium kribbense]|uniref:Uncharacterized protein n=1 Tax=Microbacterium kribbense TaxID=433645 RepID=A0ABP7GEB3_9MICO